MVGRVALVVLVLISGLAGCSGGSPGPAPSGTAAPSAGGATPANATPAPSLTGIAPGRTLSDGDGHRVTVMPVTLRREGKLALLEVVARNDDAKEAVNLGVVLDASSTRFDGVTLVDPAAGKRYMVARDSKDACLCTTFLGGFTLEPGGVGVVSAYFAAPPDPVTSLNVELPQGGVFTGVPISS
jgi:hypothetical protein